jgi:hypothetical protein
MSNRALDQAIPHFTNGDVVNGAEKITPRSMPHKVVPL